MLKLAAILLLAIASAQAQGGNLRFVNNFNADAVITFNVFGVNSTINVAANDVTSYGSVPAPNGTVTQLNVGGVNLLTDTTRLFIGPIVGYLTIVGTYNTTSVTGGVTPIAVTENRSNNFFTGSNNSIAIRIFNGNPQGPQNGYDLWDNTTSSTLPIITQTANNAVSTFYIVANTSITFPLRLFNQGANPATASPVAVLVAPGPLTAGNVYTVFVFNSSSNATVAIIELDYNINSQSTTGAVTTGAVTTLAATTGAANTTNIVTSSGATTNIVTSSGNANTTGTTALVSTAGTTGSSPSPAGTTGSPATKASIFLALTVAIVAALF